LERLVITGEAVAQPSGTDDCSRSTRLEPFMRFLPPQAVPLLHAMWRHKWLGVATAWLVCTAGWIGVALVPTKYESSARVYLNADPLLTPLLRGLAADTDPTRQLDFMQRTLLSRPNLEQLVRMTDLDIGVTTAEQKEALFKRLASDISVAPVTLNLLTLSYRDRDPNVAKTVVQSLLRIFAETTAGNSRAEMDNAQRFLDSEINSYRDQLRAAEKRRAQLAQQYPDIVSNRPPDAGAGGDESLSRLDQARAAVSRLKLDLADAETKRDALQKELAAVPATLSVERAPQVIVTGGRLTPIDERLQEVRRNLDSLTASVIGDSCHVADRRIAARTSRESPGERDDEPSAHRRDRVGDVPFGSDRRHLWVGNPGEWQIAGAAGGNLLLRGAGCRPRRSESRVRRYIAWRGGESRATRALHNHPGRALV